jgi:hypothetical protein
MPQEENVNSEPESASIASDLVQDNGDEFGNESDYGRDVLDEEDDDLYEDEEGEPDYDDDEDEEEPDDEESSEEENSQDSKSYREMQSMYSKTQNRASELEGNLSEIENRLAPLGGLDKVVEALSYIQNDPEFRSLAMKKSGQSIPGIDESKLTGDQREALDLVKQTVQAELRGEMNKLRKNEIEPLTDQVRQTGLDTIADDLLNNYGEQFTDQLESIERLAKTLPKEQLDNPTYQVMEDLFHKSLREDGKAEDYYLSQHQDKTNGKRRKSNSSPSNSSVEAKTPAFKKPKTMFDAMKISDRKAAFRGRNRKR